jgi:hypothetical protein
MKSLIALPFLLFINFLSAQDEKGKFFTAFQMSANFCQIDGDNASGYNKFGYTVNTWVGQNLGHGWTYECGVGLSNRGSRRPFNPDDPGSGAFHYNINSLDIPVFAMKKVGQQFRAGAGLRTTWLLNAKDKEGSYLNLQDDLNKSGMLGCLALEYSRGGKSSIRFEAQYSISDIRKKGIGQPANPIWRTGAYYNIISLGLNYRLSDKTTSQ